VNRQDAENAEEAKIRTFDAKDLREARNRNRETISFLVKVVVWIFLALLTSWRFNCEAEGERWLKPRHQRN
jgi:hypothetical protein